MSQPGQQYALYIHHSTMRPDGLMYIANPGVYQQELKIALPGGDYRVRWVDPAENKILEQIEFSHAEGLRMLKSPIYEFDIALSIQNM
jgi:hypothetical protein